MNLDDDRLEKQSLSSRCIHHLSQSHVGVRKTETREWYVKERTQAFVADDAPHVPR